MTIYCNCIDVDYYLALLAELLRPTYLHTFTHALAHAYRLTLAHMKNHTIAHALTVTHTHTYAHNDHIDIQTYTYAQHTHSLKITDI